MREKYRVYSEPDAHGRVLLPTPPGMKALDGGGIARDLMAERSGTPTPGRRRPPEAGERALADAGMARRRRARRRYADRPENPGGAGRSAVRFASLTV